MDKELLFKPRLLEADVELPDVGTVRVRGLSRQEMLDSGLGQDQDVLGMERRMLARAMVDPRMSEDDVAEWQRNSPAHEMTRVIERVNELSGITQRAFKEAYKSDGSEPVA